MGSNENESAISIITKRRSVRDYRKEQITSNELTTLLEAARLAPSAKNQQPWHFTVVQNSEKLLKINEGCRSTLLASGDPQLKERASSKEFSIFYNAPTVIIVSADPSAVAPLNDATLAVANIFFAATALNLGTCWIHAIIRVLQSESGKALVKDLSIPESYVVQGAIAVGYKNSNQTTERQLRNNTITIIG